MLQSLLSVANPHRNVLMSINMAVSACSMNGHKAMSGQILSSFQGLS